MQFLARSKISYPFCPVSVLSWLLTFAGQYLIIGTFIILPTGSLLSMEGDAVADKEFIKKVLLLEITPATGCTEIGAVALATGWAMHALGDPTGSVQEIDIEVDERTYKNAFGVGIPGTNEVGLEFAAAIGAMSAKNVERGLQILQNPNTEVIEGARRLMEEKKIRIARIPHSREIMIQARIRSRTNRALAIIQGSHDNVIEVQRNGNPYKGSPPREGDLEKLSDQMKGLKYRDLFDFVKSMDVEEYPIIRKAMEMNIHFAEETQKMDPSPGIGKIIGKFNRDQGVEKGLSAKAWQITALAVEARMSGLDLPVMACAGSGNQGLVATIPVVETAKAVGASDDHLLRALMLSYLTTIYIKTYTGVLSPICGCGIASAVGAGCAVVFLLGGGLTQVEAQINNMVGTMAGMICDGAKSGCSLKALMSVEWAMESAHLSMGDYRISPAEGIVGKEVEDTLRNLEQIIEAGMASMDEAIVKVMERKEDVRRGSQGNGTSEA
jgi:L-cysteine desulfidase